MNDVNPYHAARDAYSAGNLKQCLKILQAAAAAGDMDCRTFLGTLFHEGTGVSKDVSRAIELYEQAAEQTNLNATFMLGRTYYLGHGVRKEKEKGIRYLKRAAFMNCTEAQAMLAHIVIRRDGLTPTGALTP